MKTITIEGNGNHQNKEDLDKNVNRFLSSKPGLKIHSMNYWSGTSYSGSNRGDGAQRLYCSIVYEA